MDTTTVTNLLKVVLATTHSIGLKAQNYHWNVTGPHFSEYHTFFAGYYTQMAANADLYAEHIRQLDSFAPGSLGRFAELSEIQDEMTIPDAAVMISRLGKDNLVLINLLRDLHAQAGELGDIGLVSTLDAAVAYHSKMQWMIEAYAR
jgi:starvation-inducible DNA-binding protein